MTVGGNRLRVYICEEQQILRDAYQAFFASHPDLETVGCSGDTGADALIQAASVLKPNVMLLGFKILRTTNVETLHAIREHHPGLAMVVLSASYDTKGISALREFSKGSSVGCSYLLKHTIDSVEQLTQVIRSVAEGRVILDQALMEGLIPNRANTASLQGLTPREMEVLSWMAKGYLNRTIAEVLGVDLATVERHINSIYNKLGDCPEQKDARIRAVMTYLRAMGLTPVDNTIFGT